MMKEFCFVMSVTCVIRPDTGNNGHDDNDDSESY
jgi:hypothetical protein